MNRITIVAFLIITVFCSCGVNVKFTKSTPYNGLQKPKSFFVIVVGDEETRKCLNYYQSDLIDSLAAKHIKTDGFYDCCVTTNTDFNIYMNGLISKYKDHPIILTTVINQVVIGYGASSSRTLKLDLIDTEKRTSLWSGVLTTNFS